jgi:hypothetical protein
MILSLAVAGGSSFVFVEGDLKLWEEVEKRADQESIFRRQRRLNSLKKPFRHDGSSPEARRAIFAPDAQLSCRVAMAVFTGEFRMEHSTTLVY